MCVLRLVLTTREVKDTKNWRCNSLFQTKVKCNNQLCSFVIDGGSCTNVVSEEACKKLGLKNEAYLSPYKVAWVNNANLQIQERYFVTYSLGRFTDQVMCDVLPLKMCHILHGHPWLYDKKTKYCGFKNTYSFQQGKKKITMIPCQDVLKVKLKKTVCSYLLHRVQEGDDILGPPLQLNGVEFSKRGVDAATLHYLENIYLLETKAKIFTGKEKGGQVSMVV